MGPSRQKKPKQKLTADQQFNVDPEPTFRPGAMAPDKSPPCIPFDNLASRFKAADREIAKRARSSEVSRRPSETSPSTWRSVASKTSFEAWRKASPGPVRGTFVEVFEDKLSEAPQEKNDLHPLQVWTADGCHFKIEGQPVLRLT